MRAPRGSMAGRPTPVPRRVWARPMPAVERVRARRDALHAHATVRLRPAPGASARSASSFRDANSTFPRRVATEYRARALRKRANPTAVPTAATGPRAHCAREAPSRASRCVAWSATARLGAGARARRWRTPAQMEVETPRPCCACRRTRTAMGTTRSCAAGSTVTTRTRGWRRECWRCATPPTATKTATRRPFPRATSTRTAMSTTRAATSMVSAGWPAVQTATTWMWTCGRAP